MYSFHIARTLRELRDISVIHAHFAYPEGFCGLIAKGKEGISLIVTIHGYELNVVPEVGYGLLLDRRYTFIIKSFGESGLDSGSEQRFMPKS